MADFMTAIKTVNKKEQNEDQLKEVTTWTKQPPSEEPQAAHSPARGKDVSSPEDVLDILSAQPSTEDLLEALDYLLTDRGKFNLGSPGPLQAQIINTLVTTIVPTFWSILAGNHRSSLTSCLHNLAGCNAVIARMRVISDSISNSKPSPASVHELKDLHSLAIILFTDDDFCLKLYLSLSPSFGNYSKAQLGWKEFVSLIGTGKVTAALARAEDLLRANEQTVKSSWLADGSKYSSWLGRNVYCFLSKCIDGRQPVGGTVGAAGQLLSKAFGLGYALALVKDFIRTLIQDVAYKQNAAPVLPYFLKDLPVHAKRQLLETSLRWLSTLDVDQQHLATDYSDDRSKKVSASAAVITLLTSARETMMKQLITFISDPVLSSSVSFVVRRACITCIASTASDELQPLLEQLTKYFGDSLFINHGPLVQQEALAQTLLLTAGTLHRITPMAVRMSARSSHHMQGVSTRLDSSNQRARWLGMVVATALSSLIDNEGSRMSFGTEDMQTGEAKWYMKLVTVNDSVGTLDDFNKVLKSREGAVQVTRQPAGRPKTYELPIINGKRAFGPERPPPPVQTEVVGEKVSEILDGDDEDEDDDLKPYAKPDSDPEDSDEDATLVNRNKIRPPVYIRDLMRMLKDDKDHDRFQMGVRHAATLIRRKADFGGEVKDHAEEIALTLCDLQDPFETEDFDELRLQALIAVLLSDVARLAPWLSKQTFSGDYSLSQRCIMLSALGLGGRELAGFKQDDLNPAPPASSTAYPSKRLGSRLHAIYSPADPSTRRLEAASQRMSHQLIKPMALSAADETTSHLDAVKVRTFSSRMDVERTKRKPAANQLAKIFAQAFFAPLVNTFNQELAAYGESSVFTTPFVLVTFLKTLAILLHAAGPATLELSEITSAFWDVLLPLRVKAINDISVLEAVLFGFLTLLEVNDSSKQRLAQEHPKQLMETQQWVELVFERTGGGELLNEGSDEETRVRTLAAGVLVKTKEVIETYQRQLIGHVP